MNWKKKVSLFLTSQSISLFGSALVQYAIIWYITLKTESGIMMMIATLCGFVPQVLISLFAGVWADKYNKKMLIMLADGIIAATTLIIAILFFIDINHMWLLFVVLVVRSLGSGVQMPTVSAFIPDITPEDKLMKVNGINATIQSIMLILAPAISGAMLANVELSYIFLVDVITAIIGITIFSFIKIEKKEKTNEKVNYFESIKEGIIYTKNHKFVFRMLIYLGIMNILITPLSILTPLLVTRTFGADPWFLTLNEIVFFVGSIIGGVVISIWGGFKNRVHTIGFGCILVGLFSILLGMPFNFIVYLVWMCFIGICAPLFNTPFITLFQEKVEADKYGRVFSLVSIITGIIVPLAMIIYGPLADIVRIEYILIVTGILFILSCIVLVKDKVIKENL